MKNQTHVYWREFLRVLFSRWRFHYFAIPNFLEPGTRRSSIVASYIVSQTSIIKKEPAKKNKTKKKPDSTDIIQL